MTLVGDTIAAVATAPGRGGVAIVRVSGSAAFDVVRSLTGKGAEPGRICLAKVRDPAAPDKILDECVVLSFAKPHSYTGEDVAEFQCHGGTVCPRRVLEACLCAGARMAERGEFTARAFLNGRISAETAEGVLDLVDAKTDRAADAALGRMAGEMDRKYRALYDEAVALSSECECLLDVDEGEVARSRSESLRERVSRLAASVDEAVAGLHEGRILRDGALVVLAGPPNAGKSSLMNALLGMRRTIVSDIPGTTRDVVEDWLEIDGWPIRLADTAGLRETEDSVEGEGVRLSVGMIGKADLVIALDCDIPGALRIHAKCDLDETVSDGGPLRVSSRTGEGLDGLRREIAKALAEMSGGADDSSGIDSRAAGLLTAARSALVPHEDPVLLANAVRSASVSLGRLVGAEYGDDLLDVMFSRFCVGK